ncbi:hypothetical protein N7509_002140 [Penicillium cosmopolitanum]|uniref:beta-glucosidase n=1 Tax=Penicillium cosmopolitanum TaxID=1131564 RepID=A0A9W9W899_9EURO|nr:uncharacterized protein N7509_002140 [Penicillium cosmopolitanum]KAJ5408257.1 hypothetical protein N7509_002140 [Penicillium cosmopolitanum]
MSATIDSILSSLSLKEKISLLAGHTFSETAIIPEKGVPSIRTADGPNGIRAPATSPDVRSACFPAASSLAASFDLDLARRFGEALGEEARAKNVNCVLGPTVCIHRHPLGGRNFESFSEDPLLAGRLASQVIQGLQQKKVAATIKHFFANEQETQRTSVNETISERALREIYLRPFEIAIKEANPWAVMTAYNSVNGTHCDSHELLEKTLRGIWRWEGLVMSDWGGTNSVADALKAGLDLDMPGPPRVRELHRVIESIEKGGISKNTIDDRVREVLRLGLKLEDLWKDANPIEDKVHQSCQNLIREAGARSIVLLKNDQGILPLSVDKTKGKKIALIGYAKNALAHGGGSASVNAHYKVTPESGLKAAFGDDVEFSYAKGAHFERLLPPLSLEGTFGTVVGLDGAPGFTHQLFDAATEELVIKKDGCPLSVYSPLGSNESRDKVVEIIGDFTPLETGSHYIASSGFGPTRVFINDEKIFEQKNNTADPMGSLFNAAPEPESRYSFMAGRTYRICLRTEPPRNIGLQILEGRSGGRLGFSPESIHDADLKMEAAQVAANADFAIVFTDGLISAVADVNKNVIVVNSTGVAVAMPWLNKVKGIMQSWFLGQECGNAIADVITGAVNPEGHLPVSFPRSIEDAPAHGNFPGTHVDGQLQVNYAEGVFVGYRHYDRGSPDALNFSFGHGLSYTKFSSRDLKILEINKERLNVSVEVINLGPVPGRSLIQLYLGRKEHTNEHPIRTLAGFKQVWVELGGQETAELCINLRDISFYDEKRDGWKIDAGEYHLQLGSSSADILETTDILLLESFWKL